MPNYRQLMVEAKQLLVIIKDDFNRCDLMRLATSMAYTTLLQIVPSLAVIFALLSAFYPVSGENSEFLNQVKEFILQNLATGSGENVVKLLDEFISKINFTTIGVVSFAFFLFMLVKLLKEIEVAFNRIWQVDHNRPLMTRFIYFWTFMTLGGFVVSLAITVVTKLNHSDIGSHFLVSQLIALSKFAITYGGGVICFFFLYKVVPNCHVKARPAFVGAIVASLMFYLASNLYGIFVKNFSSHKNLYGALAALPLFLMWLQVVWSVILIGGVLAWRSGMGFDLKDRTLKQMHAKKFQDEEFAQTQLKAYLPFAVFVVAQLEFEKGEGKGLSLESLSEWIQIPRDLLKDALDTLTKHNYFHTADHQLSESVEEGEYIYYPSYPMSAIRVDEIAKSFPIPPSQAVEHFFSDSKERLREIMVKISLQYYNESFKAKLEENI